MQLKVRHIKPNPFKKEIGGGKLNEEQIEKIKANLKELGFMGSLTVFKRDEKHYLVSGHHRLQACKEVFGDDYEIDVDVKEYNDEQILRGMVVENLTQRSGEFKEETANVLVVRKYLLSCKDLYNLPKGRRTDLGEHIGSRQIAEWISKDSTVMSHTKVAQLLSIADNLDEGLQAEVEKTHKGSAERRGEVLSFVQAEMLSKVSDKNEQKDLAKVLKNSTEQRVREQSKLLTRYKEAEPELKKAIRTGKSDLTVLAPNWNILKTEEEKAPKDIPDIDDYVREKVRPAVRSAKAQLERVAQNMNDIPLLCRDVLIDECVSLQKTIASFITKSNQTKGEGNGKSKITKDKIGGILTS